MPTRLKHDGTPEGRVAAACNKLMRMMAEKHRRTESGPTAPDYADFRDFLRPYLRRECLLARIEQSRKNGSQVLTAEIRDLAAQLAACEQQIDEEDRL
jgi:hypothetical protein